MRRLLLVGVALLGCAIASLFVHDLAISHLGVPYPNRTPASGWQRFAATLFELAGGACLVVGGRGRLASLGLWRSMLLIAALVAALEETLRVVVINATLAADHPGHPYVVFALARFVPAPLALGVLMSLTLPLLRTARTSWRAPRLLALILLAASDAFVLLPAADLASARLTAMLGAFDADNRFVPPYPAWVFAVIYVTFIEPTVAAYVIVGLIRDRLCGGVLARTAQACLVLCLLHGRIGLLLIDSWRVDAPSVAMRFAATGQFVLETMVLGILVSLLWERLPLRAPGRNIPVVGMADR